jgi:hypothetical protein
MVKLKSSVLLSGILLILSSCAGTKMPQTNLYGPALHQTDIAYLPKPLSSDSSHHASYISVAVIESNGADPTNDNDQITRGELNFGQGFTFKNFNLGYSAFGAVGSYSNMTDVSTNDAYYFNNIAFGAVGGRFSANAFVTSGRVDIRFIGFEAAYSREFGSYANYRKKVVDSPYFYTDQRTELLTLGGTSEVIWHSHDPAVQFGFRLFIGSSLGNNSYQNHGVQAPYYNQYVLTSSLAYFMQIHQYFFVGELNANGGQFRVGLRF